VVLLPLSGSVTTEGGGLVIGYCDERDKTEVEVILNGKGHKVELWDGVFDLDLDWAEGANKIAVGDQAVSLVYDAYAEAPRVPVVHQAMVDNCGNCHRLGAERSLDLRGKADSLCRGCHGKRLGTFAHGTAACGSCHQPHTSWKPRLLKSEGNGVCTGCHAAQADAAKTAHGGYWDKATCNACHPAHAPRASKAASVCAACHTGVVSASRAHGDTVRDSCGTCHRMHGPKAESRTKAPPDSCGTCHPETGDAGHRKILGECGSCHGLHRARDKQSEERLCRPCHEPIFAKKRLHGPDAVGDCSVCHPLHDVRNRSPAIFSCTRCHGRRSLKVATPVRWSRSIPAWSAIGSTSRRRQRFFRSINTQCSASVGALTATARPSSSAPTAS